MTSVHLTIADGNIWHIDIFREGKHHHSDIANIPSDVRDALCQMLVQANHSEGAVHSEKEIKLQ